MPSERFIRWQRQVGEKSLTAVLILQASFIFALVPLGTILPTLTEVLSSVVVLALVFAIVAMTANRGVMFVVVGTIVLGILANLINEHHQSLRATLLDDGTHLMAILAVSTLVAKTVFRPGPVTAHHIRGAVVLYLNLAGAFAIIYSLILTVSPNAFAGITFGASAADVRARLVYFSLTTLTTTGYGDITPIQPIARSLSNLESVIGQLYPATLLARIVTLSMRRNP
jgi:hypothetical protein